MLNVRCCSSSLYGSPEFNNVTCDTVNEVIDSGKKFDTKSVVNVCFLKIIEIPCKLTLSNLLRSSSSRVKTFFFPSKPTSTNLPSSRMTKLQGRELFESLGSPKKIVAPMVDQSELAWRILSRKYGATLCYTPMFHARLFATTEKYRKDMWSEWDGDSNKDRPLVVQFCANDPEYLLQAARFVVGKCDAVDLNLGCPQGIAKKGKYGAFLMDDWELISKLINKLHTELEIPVTAKIRVYEDRQKTLDYAKMVLAAGAQFLTVHGRTREMKGQKTGLADWEILTFLRENLPKDTVFFANGNILYPDDITRCLNEIKCDAVMSAEGNLYNPGIFSDDDDIKSHFPRVDKLLREYYEIVKECPGNASKIAMKSHIFKILRPFLEVHTDIRQLVAKLSPKHNIDSVEDVVKKVEEVVEGIFQKPDIEELDQIKVGEKELWGGSYKTVPYWRCQPYFRPVNGVTGDKRAIEALKAKDDPKEGADLENAESAKRKADEPLENTEIKKTPI